MKQVIAYLTARGAQLPAGEESRLVRTTLESGAGDRFAIEFSASTDQSCIWTIPGLFNYPADSEPYIKLLWYSATSGGSDVWRVTLQTEASDPSITHDNMATANWDGDLWEEDITHGGGANELQTTTLTIGSDDYDDDVEQGDQWRIRIGRNADHANDTFDDEIYLIGAVVYSERSITQGEFLTLDGDDQLAASGFSTVPQNLDDLGDVTISSPDANHTIVYNTGTSQFENRQLALAELQTVSISSPANTEVLTFNGSSWVNAAAPTAGNLDSLSDVGITSAADNDQLRFDGMNWINEQYSSGYTADDESSAYSAQSTEDVAKLDDLNALRVAYENLRAELEAIRTYLGA